MVDLKKLRVSQTKNGYQKIAKLIIAHPSDEVLANVYGTHAGINLAKSQVANMLGAARGSKILPRYWDDIRGHGERTIEAFSLVASLFSHHKFIKTLLLARANQPVGYLARSSSSQKAYTNLVYALATQNLCTYKPGAPGTQVNFAPLMARLANVGGLVQLLLRDKLALCGWEDPDVCNGSGDAPFIETCVRLRFHELFGLSAAEFERWLTK